MPIQINGKLFYSTTETCEKAGISRATLYRWLQRGVLEKLRKDRRGWRLFTDDDLNKLRAEIEKIEVKEVR